MGEGGLLPHQEGRKASGLCNAAGRVPTAEKRRPGCDARCLCPAPPSRPSRGVVPVVTVVAKCASRAWQPVGAVWRFPRGLVPGSRARSWSLSGLPCPLPTVSPSQFPRNFRWLQTQTLQRSTQWQSHKLQYFCTNGGAKKTRSPKSSTTKALYKDQFIRVHSPLFPLYFRWRSLFLV